jgi:hypothetical protein
MTLGTYYETYKGDNNNPVEQQRAALIGTELKGY